MHHPPQQPPVLYNLVIYVIVAAFILFRYSRPMKMSITRLFVAPFILVAITVLAIWSGQQIFPAPPAMIAVAVIVGVILGAPLGLLMSAHRVVRRTEKPHIMYVEPSWLTAVIWVAALILRAVIRMQLPASTTGSIVGDGLVVFGISAVLMSYAVIYRKFRALDEVSPSAI